MRRIRKTTKLQEVPLTVNYNTKNHVGKVIFNENTGKLLAGDKYIIAPGFLIKEQDDGGNIVEAELVELSVIRWDKYCNYD